jgi:hypothetical protein
LNQKSLRLESYSGVRSIFCVDFGGNLDRILHTPSIANGYRWLSYHNARFFFHFVINLCVLIPHGPRLSQERLEGRIHTQTLQPLLHLSGYPDKHPQYVIGARIQ